MNNKTISQKLARLNEILTLLQNPETELEEALKLYEESVLLAKECRTQLQNATQVVEELSKPVNEDE